MGRFLLPLLALLLLVPLGPAVADEREDREVQLQALQARIQVLMSDMANTRGRRDDVQVQLGRLERDLGRVHKELRRTESRLKDSRKKLKKLEKKASVEEAGLQEQRLALAGSLRAAYAEGRQPMVKLLLNQEDPDRIGRLVGYHAYIQRDRIQRVKAIRKRLDRVLKVESDIRLQTARLEELISDQRKQAKKVKTQTTARERLLSALEKVLKKQGNRVASLQADEHELEQLMDRIVDALSDIPEDLGEDQSVTAQRGALPWPVKGRLQLRYGKPRVGDGRPSRGVLIRAKEGNDIQAVARGRVVFADWLNGMGMLLVVEHADDFMTLYGHNQSLYKEVGEWVEAGEVIGTVGNTGGQSHAGLYFEIRRKGKPINPSHWCKKPKGNKVG